MKIIVDTNVLVSAVLKGREPRSVVQFIIDNTTCDWIVSEEILAEYKEVIRLISARRVTKQEIKAYEKGIEYPHQTIKLSLIYFSNNSKKVSLSIPISWIIPIRVPCFRSFPA
ncbi:MAG: PIN domain-containing protein [Stigonema ocellatum SAG 48.90 = DSM 106950]|nr:PIN domain-containing protein [Stigonema ocellatum SAG 48.90 = DSM 106950]